MVNDAALRTVAALGVVLRRGHRRGRCSLQETGATSHATKLRYRERILGTTTDARPDLRIRYVTPTLATVHTVTPVAAEDFRDL